MALFDGNCDISQNGGMHNWQKWLNSDFPYYQTVTDAAIFTIRYGKIQPLANYQRRSQMLYFENIEIAAGICNTYVLHSPPD